MQDVQGPFFYHSNCRLGADGGLGEERQLLVEEQKLCRSRARKFSLETNRRRRALEERQKQQDVHEQQLIENILKQRRQRVQDATERFQRAHLPASQRRRPFFRRNVPNIEDALNQIQGSPRSSPQQSSFLSGNFNISSCTPSPKPPTLSKSSHRQALSAVEAYTKRLQEQSVSCFKSRPQIEETQEKQHDRSPQDSQLSDCSNSESVSSKDSLENEDHSTTSITNPQYSCSSFLLHSEKPRPDLQKPNDLLTSLSAVMLVGDNSSPSRKLHEPEQQKRADSEGPDNMHVPKASWGFTPRTQTQPALHNCNLFTLCEIVSPGREHFEVNSPNSDNIVATNRVVPGNAALDSSCPKQEALLGLRHNDVHDDKQLKHLSATEILLPAPTGDSRHFLFGPPSKPNIVLSDSATDNTSQEGTLQQLGKENNRLSSQKELSASINNLDKVSNSEPRTASLQRACLSNIQSYTPEGLQGPRQQAQSGPVSAQASHPVCHPEVRFLKGILKKTSKYMPSAFGPGHLIFARQMALAIRDSVELTRSRSKGAEGHAAVKKKLRWFDEVHVEEDTERNAGKQMKGKSTKLNNNSKDHQPRLATVSGASRPGPDVTPTASTGYHFTKQAWADVGVQVSSPQERADEVKVPRSSTRPGCPRVPRRESPARAGGGPVSLRTRKGTVIRPQSATEVGQIAKTRGNAMVPRPPPRAEWERTASIARAPYGVDLAGVGCKQALCEQTPHKDASDGFFSPHTHDAVRTDSTVMYTPMPPSCTHSASKGNTKGTASSGQQETPGCGSRRRGMGCNDKGLALHCTPTDEEISQLWHGVRSALTTKEAKNMLRRQVLDLGRVVRKPCVEQSRQPPGLGLTRLPAASQPTKQTTEPVRPFSSSYNMDVPYEGLVSAAQFHLAGRRAGGPLGEADIMAAVETAQTQIPGQQRGPTAISLEEQKILLSLDRLNQQLYCVRAHVGGDTSSCGPLLIDAHSAKEVKVTGHHKHRASSANSRFRAQKRF
ncbi:centrosomal protein of 126 kDa isoform X2 [Clinocottus analis]|uniref:centrosomal protein of 126 kDa isoform X2 n=1 Tax=Clinocottus analis TaxID=304258 RepID=UPI0035BF07E1